jgi:hypothetical protein
MKELEDVSGKMVKRLRAPTIKTFDIIIKTLNLCDVKMIQQNK